MKKTSAANLALILVVAGWLLACYGVMSQLGDPSPSVPHAQIEAARHQSLAVLFIGVASILTALWLSGYSFSTAKVRASACAALVFLPSVAVVWSTLL
ncbi:hypothetical protein [Rhodanobacter sp. C03]|uniref:hypothetical protein n=1 Tax=Rhodanobacter sp. C03 TaxID=1945858 RepID=UPI001115AAD5|nr:hypothetical protein [Rhodanobacter sp. C03]